MPTETRGNAKTDALAFIAVDTLTALWRQKKMIVAAAVFCGFVAAIATLFMSAVYESNATLLLLPPPFKERGADTRIDSKDLVGMFPKLLTTTDYATLLKEGSLLLKVVDKLRAKGVYSDKALAELSKPSMLGKNLKIETRVEEKTAYKTEYSPVIRLVVRAESPEMARDIAQAWADVAVAECATFYKAQNGGMTTFFTSQLDRTTNELEQVYAKQREVGSAWDETSAHERLIEKALLLTRLEDERARVLSDMESAKKEVEQFTASLALEKPTVTLWKSPPTTAVFLKESLSSPDANAEETRRQGYYDETVNETYLYLQQELARRQATFAGQQEREKSLQQSIGEAEKELATLRADTAKYSTESSALKLKQDALMRGYDIIADRLRQARVAESEQDRLSDLQLVANAVAPDMKAAPMRKPIVLAAMALGLAISCLAALLRSRIERVA